MKILLELIGRTESIPRKPFLFPCGLQWVLTLFFYAIPEIICLPEHNYIVNLPQCVLLSQNMLLGGPGTNVSHKLRSRCPRTEGPMTPEPTLSLSAWWWPGGQLASCTGMQETGLPYMPLCPCAKTPTQNPWDKGNPWHWLSWPSLALRKRG